jgi:hypothetical protein
MCRKEMLLTCYRGQGPCSAESCIVTGERKRNKSVSSQSVIPKKSVFKVDGRSKSPATGTTSPGFSACRDQPASNQKRAPDRRFLSAERENWCFSQSGHIVGTALPNRMRLNLPQFLHSYGHSSNWIKRDTKNCRRGVRMTSLAHSTDV